MFLIRKIPLVVLFLLFYTEHAVSAEHRCGKLNNGMKICMVPYDRIPFVYMSLLYGAGAMDDAPALSGRAHFLEHMMFRSIKGLDTGGKDVLSFMSSKGYLANAYTTYNMTGYHAVVPNSDLEYMMSLESNRMRGLDLFGETNGIKHVELERGIVIEEKKMRAGNVPLSRMLIEHVIPTLFFNCAVHGSNLPGWDEDLRNIQAKDLQDYYDKFYHPDNAVLLVVGDVEFDYVMELAEQSFGAIKTRSLPLEERLSHKMCPIIKDNIMNLQIRDINVKNRHVLRAYRINRKEDKAGICELEAISNLLSFPNTGVLYKKLVMEKGLAISVSVDYMENITDFEDMLFIDILPTDDADLSVLSDVVDNTLSQVMKGEYFSEYDLERIRGNLLAELTYSKEGIQGMGRIYEKSLITGNDNIVGYEDLTKYLYNTLTVDSVLYSINSILSRNTYVQAALLPSVMCEDEKC